MADSESQRNWVGNISPLSKSTTSHDDETPVSSPSKSIKSDATQSSTPSRGKRFLRFSVYSNPDSTEGEEQTQEQKEEQKQRIEFVYHKISKGVDMKFDYLSLLVIASIVAGMGLATGSSTSVISSMLLSPIMGPVIGMSYGIVIFDKPLFLRSLRNELLSILMCWVLGFLIAAATFWTNPMADDWPTVEMVNRGTKTSMLSGLPVAFVSGMGVALSVMNNEVSGLVGVAISASLLPPAVNSGMLILIMLVTPDPAWSFDEYHTILFNGGRVGGVYHPRLSMAITSLFLTISNVVLVALGAILMFRIKEVMQFEKTVFWTDLKMARTMKYLGIGTDDNVGGGAGERGSLAVEKAGADESHSQNEEQQQQQPYPELEV